MSTGPPSTPSASSRWSTALSSPIGVGVISAVAGAVVGGVFAIALDDPADSVSDPAVEFDNPDGSVTRYDSTVGASLNGSIDGHLVDGQTVWVANRPHQTGDLSEADLDSLYFAPGPCAMEQEDRWSCNQVFLGNSQQPGDYDVFVFLASPNAARMLVRVVYARGEFAPGLGLDLVDSMVVTREQ